MSHRPFIRGSFQILFLVFATTLAGCTIHHQGASGAARTLGWNRVETKTEGAGTMKLYRERLIIPGLYFGFGSRGGGIAFGYQQRQRATFWNEDESVEADIDLGWFRVFKSWSAPSTSSQTFVVTGEAVVGFAMRYERHRKGVVMGASADATGELGDAGGMITLEGKTFMGAPDPFEATISTPAVNEEIPTCHD